MSLQSQTIWGSKLDGNANDVLGSYNGTSTNITYSNGNGIINNGAGFAGTGNIAISATPVLGSTTTSRSFFFWTKNTVATTQWLMTQQIAASFRSLFDIYLDSSGRPHLFMNPTNAGGDQLDARATGSVNDGAFHSVLITYDGSKSTAGVNFYIDGSSSTTVSVTNTMTTTTVTIDEFRLGDRGGAGSAHTGALDEFTVFSGVLTGSDATTLHNAGAGIQYPFAASGPANLKSYNTNVIANIKSINTNPIANVKSLNTNV